MRFHKTRESKMKTSYILTAGILAVIAGNADASHLYANSISLNNIATIQDSIMHTAMHTFDRVPAANLGGKKKDNDAPHP